MQTPTRIDDLLSPYEWYRAMRASQPVLRHAESGGWFVFGYDDVGRVLRDHAVFSSGPPHATDVSQCSMLTTDPPRHNQLRGPVAMAFTPRAIAELEPRVTVIVEELLDGVVGSGEMDGIADLGLPLPCIVIAEMLGVDPEHRASFKRWSEAFIEVLASPSHGTSEGSKAELTVQEMYRYFAQVIEGRRRHPTDDLIGRLVAAEVDGQRLAEPELLATCGLLLTAGNETTTNLIGNAAICLAQNPEALDRLRQRPALVESAIEEVLRYLSPVQYVVRFARRAVTMRGQEIRAGQPVFPVMASANRDEAQFSDPDRFDVERDPNRHLAFSGGIHFCTGAALARLEARVALTAMLQRLPGRWEILDGMEKLTWTPLFLGAARLPMRWTG